MNEWIMVAICFVSAILLLTGFQKENRIYRILGGFLALLGVYKTVDALTGEALSFSWFIWVKRAVLVLMVVYVAFSFWKMRKASDEEETEDN